MANTKSVRKRVRQIERRTVRNRARRSRVRTYLRKVEEAIEAKDKTAAEAAFKEVMPEMHRSVGKGIMHRNTVDRKLSRLSSRIKAL